MTGDPKGYYSEHPGGSPLYRGTREANPLALASMILGIVGLVFMCAYGFGGVFSVAALVTGNMAKKQNLSASDRDKLQWGKITGWIGVAVSIVIVLVIIAFIILGVALNPPMMADD